MRNAIESITDHLGRKRVRNAIDRFIRIPKRIKHPALVAPINADFRKFPRGIETQEFIGMYLDNYFEPRLDPGLIGTAYDLWLRVMAIKLNRLGKNRFRELSSFGYYLGMNHHRDPENVPEMDRHLETLDRVYDNETVGNSDCLRACLYLAQYDTDARAGRGINSRFHDVVVDQFEKLVRLPSLIPLVGEQIVLSPHFELAGNRLSLVGAGDIFVDGILYEIKATSEFRVQPAIRQLVCYYMVNRLTREHFGQNAGLDICKLVAVLPRYGFTLSLDVDDMFIENGYERLRTFFVRELKLSWALRREMSK